MTNENPGSVEDPETAMLAYSLYKEKPEYFNQIYSERVRSAYKLNRNIDSIGVVVKELYLYPEQGMQGDVAFDLKTSVTFRITRGQVWTIPTGIKFIMPKDTFALIKGRGGIARNGVDIAGGVIDPTFTGEVRVVMQMMAVTTSIQIDANGDPIAYKIPDDLVFKKGDRIAQIIFFPMTRYFFYPMFNEHNIKVTPRGAKGFGSTDTR